MEYGEIACLVGFGVLVQFVAAILGPRVLTFVSALLFLAAAGAAIYLIYLALNAEFAGVGADAQELALDFGIIAFLYLLGHYFVRGLFRRMARYSHA
jgi:hypothetical protein